MVNEKFSKLDFDKFVFSPVIVLPLSYEVYDFSKQSDRSSSRRAEYGVGKYDEVRPGMYKEDLFQDGERERNIHIGIDIGAPVGTAVHSFHDGEIFLFGYNGAPGDYGYTLILKYRMDDVCLYALYGHLSAQSVRDKHSGQSVRSGEVIGWIGDFHENGGWPPHVHFQLCLEEPTKPDLPGVVCEADREDARRKYPDPRLVLGKLYE